MSWSTPPCGLNTKELYQAFSHFSGRFKGYVYGQEDRAEDSLETRLLKPCRRSVIQPDQKVANPHTAMT